MGQQETEMRTFLLRLLVLRCHQGHGNGRDTRKQAEQKFSRSRRDFCGETNSVQTRAGGVPWAAAGPGSPNIVRSWAGWHILKGVKIPKQPSQQKNNLLWIKRPNKLSLHFNTLLHLQHIEMRLTVASVHTR